MKISKKRIDLFTYLKKETFLLGEFPTFIGPIYIFVILQNIYSNLTKGKSDKLIHKIGKEFGQQFFLYIKKNKFSKTDKGNFMLFLKQISFFGLGEFQILRYLENKSVIIKNSNNSLSKQYRKSFGIQKKCKNYFTCGLLEGAFIELSQNYAISKETLCIAQNKTACVYEITKKRGEIEECEMMPCIGEFDPDPKLSYNLSLRKVIQSGHLTLEKGELKVWNLPILGLPFSCIDMLSEQLNKSGYDIEPIINYLAYIQTERAVTFMRQKFGFKEDIKILNHLFHQQELMIGVSGKFAIKHNQFNISLTKFVLFDTHMKLTNNQKTFHAPYVMAIIKSFAYIIFQKEIKEIKFVVRSKKLEEIHIFMKAQKKDMHNILAAKIPSNYQKLIEEKTKHKYY